MVLVTRTLKFAKNFGLAGKYNYSIVLPTGYEDVFLPVVPLFILSVADNRDGNLRCSDLPGGHAQCKGMLFCLGDLYGCKCAPGWRGNSCDKRKFTQLALKFKWSQIKRRRIVHFLFKEITFDRKQIQKPLPSGKKGTAKHI